MLKKHFSLYMNFDKDSLEPMSEDSDDIILQKKNAKEWLASFTSGINGNFSWNAGHPHERPLKSNIANGFSISQLSAVYLLDDEKVSMLKERGGLLFAGIGLELETLSSLFFDDYQFSKTLDIPQMTSWDEIGPYISPCTDIIIVDQYIASQPDVMAPNLYSLVDKLSMFSHLQKINIVIFTLKENYDKIAKITFTPDWASIRQQIQKKLERTTGVKPSVSFVLSSHESFGEHDRTIFTNYRYLFSGDSFNYFDNNNIIISKGRNLVINSLAKIDNLEISRAFLSDMQMFINRQKALNNPDLIIGDKESKYLSFA